MTQRSLSVLIVLNVILVAALSVTVLNPMTATPAHAQFGGSRQYTMIAGEVAGRSSQAAIYIVDTSSSKVVPVFYNSSSKKFEFFGGRVLSEDFEKVGTGR